MTNGQVTIVIQNGVYLAIFKGKGWEGYGKEGGIGNWFGAAGNWKEISILYCVSSLNVISYSLSIGILAGHGVTMDTSFFFFFLINLSYF